MGFGFQGIQWHVSLHVQWWETLQCLGLNPPNSRSGQEGKGNPLMPVKCLNVEVANYSETHTEDLCKWQLLFFSDHFKVAQGFQYRLSDFLGEMILSSETDLG